jgi:fermentation-respiration switch protein FrsA (DUF1100 family)
MAAQLLVVTIAALAAIAILVRAVEAQFAFFPSAGEQQTPDDLGLTFEPATLTTSDGERLRAWLLPNPTARALVVYFHGNGGNLSLWLPILEGLQRQGFTVAAIDYRGYGASTGRPSEQGLYRDVDAAVEWSSRLVTLGRPVVYWGRSLGTTMAAYAAAKHKPGGLILEAGFASARSLLRASPLLALLSVFSSYRFPTAEYAERAGCPVLVMHGDADRVVPYSNGRVLHDALPEPKRFQVIRGGDHNDLAPPDPQVYWTAVQDFVASLK